MQIVSGLEDPLNDTAFLGPGPKRDNPGGRRQCPVSQEHYRRTLDRLLNTLNVTYPGGTQPRGIVTLGGGKFWPGVVAGLRLLRKEVGWAGPVQVWHRGSCEPVDPRDVDGLDVEIVDADALARRLGDSRVPAGSVSDGGWEAKTYALTHCPFDAVLFLDADAYAVNDPDRLFAEAEEGGFVYWEDTPRAAEQVNWGVVYPEGRHLKTPPPVQGGQVIIDRRKCWETLAVAHWMNQHSDFYYGHMYGDQDTWRVALPATGNPWKVLGPAVWRGEAFVCHHAGRPAVVHRVNCKLMRAWETPAEYRDGWSKPQVYLPREPEVVRYFSEVLAAETDRRTPAEVFTECYDKKLWGGDSGVGSTWEEARYTILPVNAMAAAAGWQSVMDVGCGDGRVAARLKFPDYRGFDVTPSALKQFAANAPGLRADVLDFYADLDAVPPADVLLCKDVLHHWPNRMVSDWLARVFEAKKWKWVLLSQNVHQEFDGQDTFLGGLRPLHPDQNPLAPFGFKLANEWLYKGALLMAPGGAS